VENVLLTLSSLLKTARAWGYARGDFRFADLTLPREGVKAEPHCFTDDEVRAIITNASEPLSTIIAVTAVLGLRIGEALALRRSDVDFAKHVIRIRQSVDAATRTISGVKSKASSADLPMSKELEVRLRAYLQSIWRVWSDARHNQLTSRWFHHQPAGVDKGNMTLKSLPPPADAGRQLGQRPGE
jgi:integrase